MDLEFKMPDLATTDSEIKVIRWLVEPGAMIKRGQLLLEVETDKSMMEVESIAAGILKTANVKPGDAVVSGQLIAVIEIAGAAVSTPAKPAGGGMFARNRAAGSAAPAPAAPSNQITLSATQRTVGRRMQESKQTAPHFYLQASISAEAIIRRRESAATGTSVAWDAFFAQAVARALPKFPRLALAMVNNEVKPAGTSDIGVAVDHEGELYVVALSDPASKNVEAISGELTEKVRRVRAGEADARQLRPTAMTITNLGSTRVESFIAIVNPPQAAILAVGRAVPTAVVVDGKVSAQRQLTLTLSVDHRVANGKYAADFLTEIANQLERVSPEPNSDSSP
jgi:pyruvate dehydrogenase E2 component (dihydrolipoamide acetyltransferase)